LGGASARTIWSSVTLLSPARAAPIPKNKAAPMVATESIAVNFFAEIVDIAQSLLRCQRGS
jgi:hypothetical protein